MKIKKLFTMYIHRSDSGTVSVSVNPRVWYNEHISYHRRLRHQKVIFPLYNDNEKLK